MTAVAASAAWPSWLATVVGVSSGYSSSPGSVGAQYIKEEFAEDDEACISNVVPFDSQHAGMPQASFSFASGVSPGFLLEPNYNSAMFGTQDEKLYFDSWLALAPNLGGGWFPSHLWTTTIPHLCRIEPAVKYAAIAVGAMTEAMSPALLGKSSYHLIDNSAGEDSVTVSESITVPTSNGTIQASAGSDANVATNVVRHYRKALTYLGVALRLTRIAVSENAESAPSTTTTGPDGSIIVGNSPERERAAAMCCLLFVIFETLHGNRENALRHINYGLQIVDQFVARTVPQSSRESSASSAHDRVRDRRLRLSSDDADAEYDIQSSQSGSSSSLRSNEQRPSDALAKVLIHSPAPYILEDEVLQVFRRLDFQAWSLGVFRLRRTRPADIKFQALDSLNPASIPECFSSLDEARSWWDLVQHWVLQFPRYMVASFQRHISANPEAEAVANAAGRLLDICDVPGAWAHRMDYLNCLERWNKAFWPLYEAAQLRAISSSAAGNSESQNETYAHETAYLQACSLRVPYLLAWIGVKSFVYSDYEAMHALTPQFKQLNALAAKILPRQPRYSWSPFGGGASVSNADGTGLHNFFGGELFTMDNGPTMALFIVSCKCRDEAVRDEALRLLAAYPRRDGFWDSKILWAIGNWNRVIEAENIEGTLYEQWRRLRQREAIFDETKPQVQMTAWVKNKQTGEFEFKRQIVRWDGP